MKRIFVLFSIILLHNYTITRIHSTNAKVRHLRSRFPAVCSLSSSVSAQTHPISRAIRSSPLPHRRHIERALFQRPPILRRACARARRIQDLYLAASAGGHRRRRRVSSDVITRHRNSALIRSSPGRAANDAASAPNRIPLIWLTTRSVCDARWRRVVSII